MNLVDRILSFHQKNRWLSHVVFWLIYLLIAIGSSKYRDGEQGTYGFEVMSDALYMSAEMVFAYAVAYFVVPQFIDHKRYLLSIAVFLLADYIACVIGRIFIVEICEPLAGIAPKTFETYKEILTDIPKLFFNYGFDMMAAASIFVFCKILKDQLIVQKKAMQLEKEKAETELKLLKTQLNPHFLFNTLNNIYSLSLAMSPAAPKAIARLADILDHMLYRADGQFVPLSSEIALIKNYIELEKLRYDERLTVTFSTHIEQEIEIPPLILLSLVENAFKHGASDDAGVPIINMHAQVEKKDFIFKILNTIAANSGSITATTNGKIGLNNLRRQLDLIYGEGYLLIAERDGNYFNVELKIDLKKAVFLNEKSEMFVG